jgi:hypothetical protein
MDASDEVDWPLDDWQPGRWWRVVSADGTVWCESSSEKEVRRSLKTAPGGGTLYRVFERSQREWREVK